MTWARAEMGVFFLVRPAYISCSIPETVKKEPLHLTYVTPQKKGKKGKHHSVPPPLSSIDVWGKKRAGWSPGARSLYTFSVSSGFSVKVCGPKAELSGGSWWLAAKTAPAPLDGGSTQTRSTDTQPPTERLRGGVWTWSGSAEPDTSLLHPPVLLEPMKKWWSSEGKRSKDGVFLYMLVLLHVSLLSLIKKYYCNIENTHTQMVQ